MAESRHLNNQHDWKVRNVTRLNRVISNWSGSVGMVSRMTMNVKVWAVLCCAVLSLLVVNPALASAEPEIPPTTPVPTEQQVVEAPAVVTPEQPAPQPAPAPEPAPEPAPPAPASVQPPAVVLPPVATVPPVTVVPAPQTQAPAPPPPAAETVAPEVTTTATQAPAPPRVAATTEAQKPAPRETEASTTSAAPSTQTEAPVRGGEAPVTTTTAVVTDATEATTEPEGSTASTTSAAPQTTAKATVSSESAASEPQTTSTTASQVAEEDVKLAVVEAPQAAVSEAALSVPLEVQTPAVPEPASEITEATIADLASLVREYERGGHNPPTSTSTSASSTTPTTTTTHGNGHNGPRPRPGDWCDNQRGPHGCTWNHWDWDPRGYPVVKNPYSHSIEFVWCDPRTGQWLKVSVNPRSSRTIEVEYRDRDFGFAVSAGPGGFSGNLAFGTFNHRPSDCFDRCRPSYQNLHRVDYRYWVDNRWQYNDAPVYNCGCAQDRVFWNNQWYDRVWWGGTQEVLGTWAPAPQPNHPPVFQPVFQKETPLSTTYVDAVVGGPVKGGDPSQVQNNATPTVVTPILSEMWRNILIVVVLAIAAVAVAIFRHRHVNGNRHSAS